MKRNIVFNTTAKYKIFYLQPQYSDSTSPTHFSNNLAKPNRSCSLDPFVEGSFRSSLILSVRRYLHLLTHMTFLFSISVVEEGEGHRPPPLPSQGQPGGGGGRKPPPFSLLRGSSIQTPNRRCSTILPLFFGKIALHLLFGWSLDKDQKSLDQSKQIYALPKFKL